MSFWKRKEPSSDEGPGSNDAGLAQKAKKKSKRSPPVAMGVKILGLEALEPVPTEALRRAGTARIPS